MVCEVCAEGRAAMDAGNAMSHAGVALLLPAILTMTQLTSLGFPGRWIRFGRGLGGLGGSDLWCVLLAGYALGCDVVWLGYALEGRRCVRWFARCVLRGGRRWMQMETWTSSIGLELESVNGAPDGGLAGALPRS